MTLYWHLGDVVVKLRTMRGMSQTALANATGMKGNTLGNLEAGGNSRPQTLNRVAKVLDVDVATMRALVPRPSVSHVSDVPALEDGSTTKVREKGSVIETSDQADPRAPVDIAVRNMTEASQPDDAAAANLGVQSSSDQTERLTLAAVSLERAAASLKDTAVATDKLFTDLSATVAKLYGVELRRPGENPHP